MNQEKLSILDINNKASEDPKALISQCEDYFRKEILDIVKKVINEKIKYIFLCGPTSSGKTTFSNLLVSYLLDNNLKSFNISLDNYFLPSEKMPQDKYGVKNFESINALDLDWFIRNIRSIDAGLETKLPLFDFHTGKVTPDYYTTKPDGSTVYIIEGIHGLNKKVTDSVSNSKELNLFIRPNTLVMKDNGKSVLLNDFRLIRRLVRDYNFRNSSAENTLDMWNSVRAGEKIYLKKYYNNAQIIVDTFLCYEPCVLKRDALKLLEQVSEDNPYYSRVERLKKLMSQFVEIDKEMIPKISLLREFIKF